MDRRNRDPEPSHYAGSAIGVRQPLAVHIIMQVSDPKAKNPTRALATEIYSRLMRGPRPAAIPTRVWVGNPIAHHKGKLPAQPPLDEAERNVVILLVDQQFFESRRQWEHYLEVLEKARRPNRDLILPISICGDAHRVSSALSDVNHVPVKDSETVADDELVFQAILTAVLRLIPEGDPRSPPSGLGMVPPRVFLCHSKTDGDALARSLRRYVYEQTQLTCFFDTHDIPHGHGVRDSIKSSIAASCVLVLWTDRLLESRWCQFEILEARSQQRPLLILDALSFHSPRVFPFFSNMPVIRWRKDPGRVLSALLLELVRTRHIRVLFESLRDSEAHYPRFMLHPPDIMDASSVMRTNDGECATIASNGELVVYPDPPLPAEELSFLREAFPKIHLHSLSEWTALRAAGILPDPLSSPARKRQSPLSSFSIGLSVSSAESWTSLGLIAEHQDDYVIDIARELILLGARLLWGGDLRPDGIGVRLESLVQAYHQADHAPQDHIACYLAWPIHHNVPARDIQARRTFADVQCLPNPTSEDVHPGALNAICFSLMRRQLASESQARILLGGRLSEYMGRYPGIAEEALETIRSGGALYIIGGFGGASRAVYDAIADPGSSATLEVGWRERSMDPAVQEMNAAYDALAQSLDFDLRVDHPGMIRCFGEFGLAELSRRNRLTADENARLAYSQDIREIIALLVRGLTRLAPTR
ncbi:hypothetical protein ACVME8_008802 [Bradyrhizobium diazoefficiens]